MLMWEEMSYNKYKDIGQFDRMHYEYEQEQEDCLDIDKEEQIDESDSENISINKINKILEVI